MKVDKQSAMGGPDGGGAPPLISVGLPVYNGENFLRHALESLVAQSVQDLEIIISDNASTDGTEGICREFAARDSRVRYIRQDVNIGAGPNYNAVFAAARGRYFKWAAHDDYMDPDALALCLAGLEADPATVLCHPLLVDVDAQGTIIAEFDRGTMGLEPASRRFFRVIQIDHNCAEVFGLTRRSVLERTGLIRNYTDSDRTLLGELALLGRLRQVEGARFYRRVHEGKSDRVYRSFHERAIWFDPRNRGRLVLSATRQLLDLASAVLRCRLPAREWLLCVWGLAKIAKWNAPLYFRELRWAWQHVTRRPRKA